MQPSIFNQAIPEPYRIFGLRLLPLSLGRYRILNRFDCSFVSEGESKATFEDLILGVLVCSMTVADFMELLDDRDKFAAELKRWGQHIRKEIRADPHFNLFAKFGLFRKYIQDANQVPKFWNEHEMQSESTAHWSHAVEIALRSQVGYTSEEIDEAPLAKALADYFQWAQGEGLIRIMTDEEEEMNKAVSESNLKAIMASMAAAGMSEEDLKSVGASVENGAVQVERNPCPD